VLVERDPVEAVLSHTNQGDQASEKDLEAGVAWWKSLQDSFENHPKDRRYLVRFEDITNNGTGWIRGLAEFLEIRTDDEAIQRCAELLGEAKKTLLRKPLTNASDTYRERFPKKAAFSERLASAQGLTRLAESR
jgi:hypothetical protein